MLSNWLIVGSSAGGGLFIVRLVYLLRSYGRITEQVKVGSMTRTRDRPAPRSAQSPPITVD